jgi:hypothetical protein
LPGEAEKTWGGKALLIAALTFGVLFRFFRLHQPQLWLDEIIQLQRFSHPSLWENLLDIREEIAATPLDYIVQSVFIKLLGNSEAVARLHAALFGCVALFCVFAVSRKLFSNRAAVMSTILISAYPLHQFYSQEGRNYSLFFLLTVCSYWALFKALEASTRSGWALYALINTALLYTNYFGVLVLLCQALVVVGFQIPLIRASAQKIRISTSLSGTSNFLTSVAFSLACFAPWVLWTYQATKPNALNLLTESDLPLRVFKEISGSGYFLSFLLLFLFGLGLTSLIRRKQWAALLVLVFWFMVPVPAVILLDWWGGYFFAVRQVLFATPGLILGAAVGIEYLPKLFKLPYDRRIQAMTALLIVGVSIGTVWISDKKHSADWIGLASYLKEEVRPRDLVAAPNVERVISFHLPDLEDQFASPQQILQSSPNDHSRVFLIRSRYEPSGAAHLMEKIASSSSLIEEAPFKGFRVLQVRLRPN